MTSNADKGRDITDDLQHLIDHIDHADQCERCQWIRLATGIRVIDASPAPPPNGSTGIDG